MFNVPEVDISYFELLGENPYNKEETGRCSFCDSQFPNSLIIQTCEICKRPFCRYCFQDAFGPDIASIVNQYGICICPDCFEEDREDYWRYFYEDDSLLNFVKRGEC